MPAGFSLNMVFQDTGKWIVFNLTIRRCDKNGPGKIEQDGKRLSILDGGL
jgi:hypothetical protein